MEGTGTSRTAACFLVTLALLLTASLPVLAQTAQGRITGLVMDPEGAVIPGVVVVAINEETGVQTTAESNEVGLYVLPFLQPGTYTITASLQGFKRYERTGIVIETSQVMELNIQMELGAVTETVTVTSAPPLLETTNATVGQFIDSRTVNDMPLGGRRALELVRLAPNVIFVNYGGFAKPRFSVAGGRAYKSTYMLDGGNIQNIRMASLQVDIDPPVEVIKEFRVVSNTYAAEYGASASGVIVSTTKSGTNELHGSGFWFLRNDKLDAAGFFAPTQGDKKIKAPLRYNLFGGTVGGPIIRNRTHYFVGYEGTRQSNGTTQILTLPTELQRRGDFSQTFDKNGNLVTVYNPYSAHEVDGKIVRDPFPGNIVPPALVDPVASALLKYYPLPNRPPTNLAGAQNFAANRVQRFRRDNVTARIDHVLTNKNRLFFRFVYNRNPYEWSSNYPQGGVGDPQAPFSPNRWQTSYLVRDTHTVSPNLVTDIGYAFSNRIWYADSAGLGSGVVQEVGLPNVSNDAFPEIRISGVARLGNSRERKQQPIRQHQITNSWTWVKSKHVVKFGGEIRKGRNVDLNRPIISGRYSFSTTGTGMPGKSKTGYGFASYLLGWVNSFSLRETEELDRYSWYLAWYLQDDWKLTPNLTLNLGLRWETDTPVTDKNHRSNGFDRNQINPVSGTPGVVKFAGVDGWPDSPYYTDWNNFGPRFGFAWRPRGSNRWVIRGGYGIFYEGPSTSANAASLGFELSAGTSSPDNGVTAAFLLHEGPDVDLSKPELNDGFGAVPVGKKPKTNVDFYELNRRTGYAQHFNFGIQRQLPGNIMLEVSYVANLSRKLPNSHLAINQVPPELMGPGKAQVRRPYPQFNRVRVLSPTIGSNNYHSGVIRVEKRLSHGLSFLSGYTWSRTIGDTRNVSGSLGDNQTYQDVYNRRLDKGPDALDIIHRFIWSSTYDLPWGVGRRWLRSGPLAHILGGWTLGAIVSFQSGGPFTVVMQSNTTNAFSAGALRANVLRDPNLPTSQRTVQRWFDTEAFESPPSYAFGNAGRGIVRADGRSNFDFAINKNFPFGEGRYVQLRVDLFNAFNHPDFGLPNRAMGSANFGTIGSATSPRTIQLGLRIVY